jgi:phycocyanobilin lyase subunit beta
LGEQLFWHKHLSTIRLLSIQIMATTLPAQTLIQNIESADSSEKLLDAVKALAEARLVEGIPMLIAALGYNNPGAAVAAVDGLIAIGKPAVEPLLELLDNFNYGARAWAIRALAGIGDPRSLSLVLEAAQEDFSLSVRRAAARGLGTVKWAELPVAERAVQQSKVVAALHVVCQDPEWVVRYAGVTGLEAIAMLSNASSSSSDANHPEQAIAALQQLETLLTLETDPAVRARINLALQRIR